MVNFVQPSHAPGDIQKCCGDLLLVTASENRIATGIWWERSEITPNILKCTGQPPTRKNNSAQNVNSTEVEKLTHSKESGSERVRESEKEKKFRNHNTSEKHNFPNSKNTWKCNVKRLGGGFVYEYF